MTNSTSIQDKKEILARCLEADTMSPKQVQFLYEVASLMVRANVTKEDFAGVVGIKPGDQVDFSVDRVYMANVKSLLPGSDKSFFVTDYRSDESGELVNLNDLFIEKLLSI